MAMERASEDSFSFSAESICMTAISHKVNRLLRPVNPNFRKSHDFRTSRGSSAGICGTRVEALLEAHRQVEPITATNFRQLSDVPQIPGKIREVRHRIVVIPLH